jgi:hypothetical protein
LEEQRRTCRVSIRQHTSSYVSIRRREFEERRRTYGVSIRQHTPAYASIRQHTSAYVSIRQHPARRVGGAEEGRQQMHAQLD